MIRKLGFAALAIAAITAVSAMAASSAGAAGGFECAVAPCIITGTSEAGTKAKFKATGIATECTAHLAATSPPATSDLTVNAEYTTGSCNLEAHVRMNHCDFALSSTTDASGHGPVTINCAEGSKIELETTAPKCILKFGAQTPAGGVNYTNVTEKTVTAKATLSKIKFTRENPEGNFLCGLIPAEGEGTYESTDSITCFEDNDSPKSGTEATTTAATGDTKEGAQVNCKHNAAPAGPLECAVERCVVTGTSEAGTKAKFKATGIATECTAHLAATSPPATSDLTVNAEYTTGSCNLEAHVRMNHCDFALSSTTDASGHGPVTINCAEGSKIELETTAPKCILKFGAQTPAGGVNYTNVTEKTVTAKATLSKIKFTRENPEGNFLCGLIPAEGEGTYESTDSITCFEDNDSPKSGTEATTTAATGDTKEGAQVNCKHNAAPAGPLECAVERCVVTGTSEAGTKAKFKATGIATECTAHLAATSPPATSDLTVNAEYTTGSCNLEAHVRMNHCDFALSSTTDASGHGPVTINCAEGSKIELETTAPKCILKFGAQTPAGGVNYTNVTEKTVTAKATLSKIKFTRENPEGNFLCGLIPAEGEGTYESTDSITCFEDNDSPKSGTEATTTAATGDTKEGAQVNCKHNPDA